MSAALDIQRQEQAEQARDLASPPFLYRDLRELAARYLDAEQEKGWQDIVMCLARLATDRREDVMAEAIQPIRQAALYQDNLNVAGLQARDALTEAKAYREHD